MTLHMIKLNDTMLAYTPVLSDARAAYDKACYSVSTNHKPNTDVVRWYKDDIISVQYPNPKRG